MRWFVDVGEWYYYEIRFTLVGDQLSGRAYSFTDVTVPMLADSISGRRVPCR